MALGRVADTSWLYAIFNDADAHHVEANAELRLPLVTLVPAPILNEFLDLVRYRRGKESARAVMTAMRDFPHFDLWYPVDEKDALPVWEENPHLSLHDAHAVALARRTGFPLATFDARQKEATKRQAAPGEAGPHTTE